MLVKNERRYLESEHGFVLDRDLYHNLIKKMKKDLGIIDSTADFNGLLEWLQSEQRGRGAVARMRLAEDRRVNGVVYMSTDMLHHLERNGQVLLMDTTFKTNRFHWPLLLVCGGRCCHVRCSHSASPAAAHIRCRYHLEANLRSNLSKHLGIIAVEQFITEWKSVINERQPAVYEEAKRRLHDTFPAAVPYLDKNHWKLETLFAERHIGHFLTLGIRSTSRVESWNSVLKGMLQINSTTALETLFRSLQYAQSEVDRRSLKKALTEAARLPPQPALATLEAYTQPHLTYYAQGMVKKQMAYQHIHKCELLPSAVETRSGEHHVWDGRDSQSAPEKWVVVAGQDHIRCSCHYPAVYLLPCRHVLALNIHLHRKPFWVGQVGERWLRYHRPIPLERGEAEETYRVPPMLYKGPLVELPNTTLQQAAPTTSRQNRHGILQGYSLTICTRAAEFKQIFAAVAMKLEELARWVEDATAVTVTSAPASVTSTGSATSSSFPLSCLHPTVPISDMVFPVHKVRQPGRVQEKRQQAAFEKAAKRIKGLSASQVV